ncbi:MAG: ABC transporter ATP-binding protein, partial [Candidatus Hydrogenedentes bacterium]|nr:ABC transporter ATP-binding protein [Candidatus Hydrogenedentota bacterium]
EVAIMYAGKIVEHGPMRSIFSAPSHPYTVGLFKSLPGMSKPGERLYAIRGTVPPATRFPSGCRFHPRCPHAMDACRRDAPPLAAIAEGHRVACWLHDEAAMRTEGGPTGVPAPGVNA